MVVDIVARIDDGGADTLIEVKAMHANPTCYRCCTRPGGRYRAPGPCPCVRCVGAGGTAIEYRASRVNPGVAAKLRKLDRDVCGQLPVGAVGPLEQRHIDLGGVLPLVVGAYGGVNREWKAVVGRLAVQAAPLKRAEMLCPSNGFCAGVLRVNMLRRLCFASARARYRLLHSRLELLQYPTARGGCDYAARHRDDERFTHARSASARYGGSGGWFR